MGVVLLNMNKYHKKKLLSRGLYLVQFVYRHLLWVLPGVGSKGPPLF